MYTGLQPTHAFRRQIYLWLLTGVVMVMVQVLLGGITRLTGSGLSITEWDVITGTIPPLTNAGWQAEFALYQQTPQFQLLNSDFTLQEFKFIYFWEWLHRFWARMLGLVFLAGFIYFLVRKAFNRALITPLVILFLLGALQGAVGWIMVASGLTGDAVYVKPTRLAMHFILALVLLAYTWWFAMRLRYAEVRPRVSWQSRLLVFAGLALLLIQLFYGALMAGHKAASAAPTWPSVNGALFYPGTLKGSLGSVSTWLGDKLLIHTVHRTTAYVLFVLLCVLSYQLFRSKPQRLKAWLFPAVLALLQVLLGIGSVLSSAGISAAHWGMFEWMALMHQASAMFILLTLVYLLYHSRHRRVI